MIVLIAALVYIAGAAAAMYFGRRLNRAYKALDEWDAGSVLVFIALLWPFAFPVFAAYALAGEPSEE